MTPVPNWRRVLRYAWSVRLMLLAALFTALEAVLPFFIDTIPRGIFAALTFVVSGAALIARFVAQPRTLPGDDDE
jgi:hypothetical protein